MESLINDPKALDYFTWVIMLLAGGAWGWILAGCWIDALKDEKKRKQQQRKG